MVHPILLVEDHADLRVALCKILEADGYTVVTAETAEEALATLEDGLRPSVVLVDLHLPRASGWEVLKHLDQEAHLRSVPTILMSGMPKDDVRVLADAVLRKPVDVNGMLSLVRNLVSRQQYED